MGCGCSSEEVPPPDPEAERRRLLMPTSEECAAALAAWRANPGGPQPQIIVRPAAPTAPDPEPEEEEEKPPPEPLPVPAEYPNLPTAPPPWTTNPVHLEVIPSVDMNLEANHCVQVLVRVQSPTVAERVPTSLCCVLDISGSMGIEASMQSEGGATEKNGLSLLDIAKHGVKTMIGTLTDQDRLAIVIFNHEAETKLGLTVMDANGKKLAGIILDAIQPCGGTNIWTGLVEGLECMRNVDLTGSLGHLMLLSDGESTDRERIMPNLTAYEEKHKRLPCTVSTFGFGYRIDSGLLVKLANTGDGSYAFIPDAGFVGTTFINLLSNLLITFAREVYLYLQPLADSEIIEVHGGYKVIRGLNRKTTVRMGMLQYQQARDVVITLTTRQPGPYLRATGHYEPLGRNGSPEVEFMPAEGSEKGFEQEVQAQFLRSQIVDSVTMAVNAGSFNRTRSMMLPGDSERKLSCLTLGIEQALSMPTHGKTDLTRAPTAEECRASLGGNRLSISSAVSIKSNGSSPSASDARKALGIKQRNLDMRETQSDEGVPTAAQCRQRLGINHMGTLPTIKDRNSVKSYGRESGYGFNDSFSSRTNGFNSLGGAGGGFERSSFNGGPYRPSIVSTNSTTESRSIFDVSSIFRSFRNAKAEEAVDAPMEVAPILPPQFQWNREVATAFGKEIVQQMREEMQEKMFEMGEPSAFIKALFEDLNGQVSEAVSCEDFFTKWGRHFLPSLMFAHKLQQCNNFKDPGVQMYGGELFEDLRDMADEIFASLPAPTPTVEQNRRSPVGGFPVRVAIDMSAYNDRNCG